MSCRARHTFLCATNARPSEPLISSRQVEQEVVDALQRLCDHCNERKWAAKAAGEASLELYLRAYISQCAADLKPMECSGIISSLGTSTFTIFIPALNVDKVRRHHPSIESSLDPDS